MRNVFEETLLEYNDTSQKDVHDVPHDINPTSALELENSVFTDELLRKTSVCVFSLG